MDEELKNRFLQLKLEELLNNSTRPFPTIICEMERPEIIELVRKFCLYTPNMKPFKGKRKLSLIPEGLEFQQVKDYGDLYIEVFIN